MIISVALRPNLSMQTPATRQPQKLPTDNSPACGEKLKRFIDYIRHSGSVMLALTGRYGLRTIDIAKIEKLTRNTEYFPRLKKSILKYAVSLKQQIYQLTATKTSAVVETLSII